MADRQPVPRTVHPDDRLHMLVWRAHPSAPDDPGWCVATALNGEPLHFGVRYQTGMEAIAAAVAPEEADR